MIKAGLTLHPDKTRLVQFCRPRQNSSPNKPGSFDFLGFTHDWGRSHRGRWSIKRKTAKGRLSRSLSELNKWMRRVRHLPLAIQRQALARKIAGRFNCYGIRYNSNSISQYAYEVNRLWHKWLGRRSHRASLTWDQFNRLLQKYPLPPARLRPGWRQLRRANL